MFVNNARANIFNQSIRNKKIKIEILDENLAIIDTIESYAISGSLSFDSDNLLRRSGNISMAIPPEYQNYNFYDTISSLNLRMGIGGATWLVKRIKVYIGIEKATSLTAFEWFNMGIYLVDAPSQAYNSNSKTIELSLIDYMSLYSGNRQGVIPSYTTLIQSDVYNEINETWTRTKFKEALISTLIDVGITKYYIANIPSEYEYLPYNIEIKSGQSRTDLWNKFLEITPNWEYFFDENGTFIYQPIPQGIDYGALELNENQVVQENIQVNLDNVKNQIIIYGKEHSCTYFATNVIKYINGNNVTMRLYFDTFNAKQINLYSSKIGFEIPLSFANFPLYFNDIINTVEFYSNTSGEYSLILRANLIDITQDNNIAYGRNLSYGKSYIIAPYTDDTTSNLIYDSYGNLYIWDNANPNVYFQIYSELQASTCIVNSNVLSPYYINTQIATENANLPVFWGLNTYSGFIPAQPLICSYAIKLNDKDVLGSSISALEENTIITFIPNSLNTDGSNIYIFNQDDELVIVQQTLANQSCDIVTLVGGVPTPIPANTIGGDYTIWKLQYKTINNISYFVLLGSYVLGVYTKVLSDGEYAVIPSTYLIQQRAEYELYLRSNLNDAIDLSIIPNYLLSINQKIKYNVHEAISQELVDLDNNNFYTANNQQFYVGEDGGGNYLIKKISFPLGIGDVQTINAMKIYDNGMSNAPILQIPVLSISETNLMWFAVPNATNYQVSYSTTLTGVKTILGETTSTTYSLASITTSGTYYIFVLPMTLGYNSNYGNISYEVV